MKLANQAIKFIAVGQMTIALLGACSMEDMAKHQVANDIATECINSENLGECASFDDDALGDFRKYINKSRLEQIDRIIERLEADQLKREKEHLQRVAKGQEVVDRLSENVDYYQDNCTERVIGRTLFGVEQTWKHCVGDDLISGLFGHWGKENDGTWKRAMFLTEKAWRELDHNERVSLDAWLRSHKIRNIYTGRTRPSTRFDANTITLDRTVWSSDDPPIHAKEEGLNEYYSQDYDEIFDSCLKKLSAEYPCLLTKSCIPSTGGMFEHNQCMNEEHNLRRPK